ncbi:hypothetical protein PG985_001837 [Apiospora marii]|uniref:Heterokaryon incompatibility domain-containing protein n=1 Tax=Apiospora marii TaxID=335849 RepID=A0ABR1RZT1_9PEZI
MRGTNLQSFRYVALSYVWGGPQAFCLKGDNILDLQARGSLQDTPNTIRDAMTVAFRLGFNYIYVDAFCIIQDDNKDKREQLSIMGKIYANATLCIVAASGDTAYSGLPGLSSPRTPGIEVLLPGCNIKLVTPLSHYPTVHHGTNIQVGYTTGYAWSERGWTFQERALSRRSLIFTEGQALWHCKQTQKEEEAPKKTHLAERVFEFVSIDDVPLLCSTPGTVHLDPLNQWLSLVRNFVRRQFGFPGDSHDAIAGTLEYFQEKHHFNFLWALPQRDFGLHLLWHGHEHIEIRHYVLKNSPLRLEAVDDSNTTSAGTSWNTLTLEEIAGEDGPCATHELCQVPDDQYLIFRAEIATFHVKVRKLDNKHQASQSPGMYQRYIIDDAGHEVGWFWDEYEVSAAERAPTVCNLAKIVTSVDQWRGSLVEGGDRSAVLSLEMMRRPDGVSTRLGVAMIAKQYWLQAERRMELVVLN